MGGLEAHSAKSLINMLWCYQPRVGMALPMPTWPQPPYAHTQVPTGGKGQQPLLGWSSEGGGWVGLWESENRAVGSGEPIQRGGGRWDCARAEAPIPRHMFHCPIRLHLQNTNLKMKVRRTSRWWPQNTKPWAWSPWEAAPMKVVLLERLMCQPELKLISIMTYQLIQLCSRRAWLCLNLEGLDVKRIYFFPILTFNSALWNLPFLLLTTYTSSREVRFLAVRFHSYPFWSLKLCLFKDFNLIVNWNLISPSPRAELSWGSDY